MARMPLGQGLDADDGGTDDGDEGLQNVTGGGQRANGGGVIVDNDRTSTTRDATVILPETKEEREERDGEPPVVILDGDQREQIDEGDDDDRLNTDRGRDHRRETRRERKERQRRAQRNNSQELNRLRRELAELRQRVDGVGSRTVRQDVNAIDQRIRELQGMRGQLNAAYAAAVTASEGEQAAQLLDKRDEIVAQLANLTSLRAQAAQAAQQPQGSGEMERLGRDWLADNPWYDPNGGDRDSRAMLAIDRELMQEGYDPNDQEFWDELTERGRDRLPHRFEEDEVDERPPVRNGRDQRSGRDDRRPTYRNGGQARDRDERPSRREGARRGPPVGGGSDVSPRDGNGSRRIYIDPDMKEALEQAGVMDDPRRLRKVLNNRDDFFRREAERTRRR